MFKSDKAPVPAECKEAPDPTSETTPDEAVITIDAETENKDDESTPAVTEPSQSHRSDTYITEISHQFTATASYTITGMNRYNNA